MLHPWSVAWCDRKILLMETAVDCQCDKDFMTDIGDFSEAFKHYFRHQKPANMMAYLCFSQINRNQVFPGIH